MRIGYAPGACLRGYLARLGYPGQALCERGLIDLRGRDAFFRCLTFPLPEAGNLYGRSLGHGLCRHRFLPGSKGGLYGWSRALAFPRVIVVEGLFDVAALWQAGFPNAVAALGAHLNHQQLTELCQPGERVPYLCFDVDRNGSGASASDFQRWVVPFLLSSGDAVWAVPHAANPVPPLAAGLWPRPGGGGGGSPSESAATRDGALAAGTGGALLAQFPHGARSVAGGADVAQRAALARSAHTPTGRSTLQRGAGARAR